MDYIQQPQSLLYLASKEGMRYILRNSLRSESVQALAKHTGFAWPRSRLLYSLLEAHSRMHHLLTSFEWDDLPGRIARHRLILHPEVEIADEEAAHPSGTDILQTPSLQTDKQGASAKQLEDLAFEHWEKSGFSFPATIEALCLVPIKSPQLCIVLGKRPLHNFHVPKLIQMFVDELLDPSCSSTSEIFLRWLPDFPLLVKAVTDLNHALVALFKEGFYFAPINSPVVMFSTFLNELEMLEV